MTGKTPLILVVLVGLLSVSADAQDSDALLRAEAAMLRRTLERREKQIEQLEAQIAELQQHIEQLQSELERARSGQPATMRVDDDDAGDARDAENADRPDRQPEKPELAAATQPSEADYYGLSRLLRAIPDSRMPGSKPTDDDREKFTDWAEETFARKQLYAVFEVKEAHRDKGRWVVIGAPERPGQQGRRNFFVTVLAEISDEQYSANPLTAGDRAKLIGTMSADKPIRPIKAKINNVREDIVYGKVVARRTVEVEIDGWTDEYAAVVVRIRGVRVLE